MELYPLVTESEHKVPVQEESNPYQKAIRSVISHLQVLIYQRELQLQTIRNREEVCQNLQLRITNVDGESHIEWQKRLLELAAYAIFAAVVDQ